MRWSPHITVAAIIENKGQFLLVKEDIRGEIIYNQPAGHLEDLESPAEAVVREALEETGWDVKAQHLCCVQLWRNNANSQSFLRFSFVCKTIQHHPELKLDVGILEAQWFSREQISQLKLRSPMILDSIDRYLDGQQYPLDLIHHLPST